MTAAGKATGAIAQSDGVVFARIIGVTMGHEGIEVAGSIYAPSVAAKHLGYHIPLTRKSKQDRADESVTLTVAASETHRNFICSSLLTVATQAPSPSKIAVPSVNPQLVHQRVNQPVGGLKRSKSSRQIYCW